LLRFHKRLITIICFVQVELIGQNTQYSSGTTIAKFPRNGYLVSRRAHAVRLPGLVSRDDVHSLALGFYQL
jgi:hypothetical protein